MNKVKRFLTSSPYRFFLAAAVLAVVLCITPMQADAPMEAPSEAPSEASSAQAQAGGNGDHGGVPAGADLSERTQQSAYLHRTMTYLPCGHSVQRREPLPSALVGLSRAALEGEIERVLPGAAITGYSAQEVDVAMDISMPCPLHWMLDIGEDGCLRVMKNLTGEAMETVRNTGIAQVLLPEEIRRQLLEGMMFDDVQALEGYLESLNS